MQDKILLILCIFHPKTTNLTIKTINLIEGKEIGWKNLDAFGIGV